MYNNLPRILLKIFIFVFVFNSCNLFSQSNEANIWYFNNGNGLDFNQNSYQNISNGLFSYGTISTICDSNSGNLLFYTDGITVIDHTHKVMKNGNDLLGHATNVIVPYPQKKGLYYIFSISIDDARTSIYEKLDFDTTNNKNFAKMTLKDFNDSKIYDEKFNPKIAKLYYHLVDMNKNNGFGEVIIKNQTLYQSISPNLTVAKHANGKDFWLITHEFTNDIFRTYLITEKGLKNDFIISKTGSIIHLDDIRDQKNLKISPTFDYLAMFGNRYEQTIYIFKFDNSIGKIEKKLSFKEKDLYFFSGFEFSPNSLKLYVNFSPNFYGGKWITKQYDLTLSSYDIIKNAKSQVCLTTDPKRSNAHQYFVGDLQLARNGKIYGLQGTKGFIGTIENPNDEWKNTKISFNILEYKKGVMFTLPNITHLLPPFYDSIKIGESFQRQILFDTQKSDIKTWHTPILQDIILFLNQNKNTKITIIGHTDNEGNKENNKKLSFQRAKSVADYIISQKIDKNRIKIEGLGDTKPIVENDSEENKTKNRRVEFLIE